VQGATCAQLQPLSPSKKQNTSEKDEDAAAEMEQVDELLLHCRQVLVAAVDTLFVAAVLQQWSINVSARGGGVG